MAKAAKRASDANIELRDVGPIKEASIPFLPDGGVVVFGGRQGVGKSIALRAVEVAATGDGKVPIRDKQKAGTIDAFGVNVRIGSRVTRGGEPSVVSLEGRLSISDLVDPGLQSVTAADARRIKALVTMAGVPADIKRFVGKDDYAASGGVWEHLSEETVKSTDLIDMAERFKRDCEAAARSQEDRAENARGRIAALKQTTEGVEGSEDPGVSVADVQRELATAIERRAEIKKAIADAAEAETRVDVARESIAKAKATYAGEAEAECLARLKKAEKIATANYELVETIRRDLKAAEDVWREKVAAVQSAKAAAELAANHFALIAGWEETIAKIGDVEVPKAADLVAADQRVGDLQSILADATMRDKMEVHLTEIKSQGATLAAASRKAQEYRDEAKRVDEVLSDVVQGLGTDLRVEGGRLLIDTESRGPTYFAELSDGERWKISLEIAIEQAAKLSDKQHVAVMVIPQKAWGELQPANRKWVAEECAAHGVCAYTAIATDDDELTVSIA